MALSAYEANLRLALLLSAQEQQKSVSGKVTEVKTQNAEKADVVIKKQNGDTVMYNWKSMTITNAKTTEGKVNDQRPQSLSYLQRREADRPGSRVGQLPNSPSPTVVYMYPYGATPMVRY